METIRIITKFEYKGWRIQEKRWRD